MIKIFNPDTGEFDYLPDEPKDITKAIAKPRKPVESSQGQNNAMRQKAWRDRNMDKYRAIKRKQMKQWRASRKSSPPS